MDTWAQHDSEKAQHGLCEVTGPVPSSKHQVKQWSVAQALSMSAIGKAVHLLKEENLVFLQPKEAVLLEVLLGGCVC